MYVPNTSLFPQAVFLLFLLAVSIADAQAQATTFSYQGQLRQSGEPYTGMADLEFRLYDQLSGGTGIGNTQSLSNWPVEDGLFQVELDFGPAAFDGSDRYLEIAVDGAPLTPRQKITATPYALLATGLASGSVGGGSVNPNEVQLRVDGECSNDERILGINEDGSFFCGARGTSNGLASNIFATVSGGTFNASIALGSTIAGGQSNLADGVDSSIGGGFGNKARSARSTVAGGRRNTASGDFSTVAGGSLNNASGDFGIVSGGNLNCAGGRWSWAGGLSAKVRYGSSSGALDDGCVGVPSVGLHGDEGTFVWADSQGPDFVSTRSNAFFVRAEGGAEFRVDDFGFRAYSNATGVDSAALQGRSENPAGIAIYGANNSADSTLVLNNGGTGDIIRGFNIGALQLQLQSDGDLVIGGSLTQNSDRNRKEAIEAIDVHDVLDALRELPVFSWRYKHDREAARHIGPMAQDFHAAFGLGSSPSGIAVVDAQGVTFAALQAMDQDLRSLGAENRTLRTQINELETRHEARLQALQEQQDADLNSLRRELAMLRELVAPRVAQEGR